VSENGGLGITLMAYNKNPTTIICGNSVI